MIDWSPHILAATIGLLLLVLVGAGLDYITRSTQAAEVTVLEKVYTPSQTDVGVGTGLNTNGKTGTGTIVTTSPKKFVLLVDVEGEVKTVQVDASVYARTKEGRRTTLEYQVGGLFGYEYW